MGSVLYEISSSQRVKDQDGWLRKDPRFAPLGYKPLLASLERVLVRLDATENGTAASLLMPQRQSLTVHPGW